MVKIIVIWNRIDGQIDILTHTRKESVKRKSFERITKTVFRIFYMLGCSIKTKRTAMLQLKYYLQIFQLSMQAYIFARANTFMLL